MPIAEYRHFFDTNPVPFPDRIWPDNRILKMPWWLSTDLRDENQALTEPVNPAHKRPMFEFLIELGPEEIEIGFSAASVINFELCHTLVEEGLVSGDVTISALTRSQQGIIHKTVDVPGGLSRIVVHLHSATSPVFRCVVFYNDKEIMKQLAMAGTQESIIHMEKTLDGDVIVGFEYSPEVFVDTEPDFVLEVYEAVTDARQPGSDREIIINLPTTAEKCTPNVHVGQIEYMNRDFPRREHVVLSAHNHNGRGTDAATAELIVLAGVDRVEGCLFSQDRYTGNVDPVTLALNLFSQGTDPELNLSDIDRVCRVIEHCMQMDVPSHTPYSGDFVYTSFSGSHRDAIKEGFADRVRKIAENGGDESAVTWDAPYLPLGSKDVGRAYEAVIYVNSQSGEGGVSYLLSSARQPDLPRCMQIELPGVVQRHADKFGGKITAEQLWKTFADKYLPHTEADGLSSWGEYQLASAMVSAGDGSSTALETRIVERIEGKWSKHRLTEISGDGPVDTFVAVFSMIGADVHILDYVEHIPASGRDATAVAYVECNVAGQALWGCGIDPSAMRASFSTTVSVVGRAVR